MSRVLFLIALLTPVALLAYGMSIFVDGELEARKRHREYAAQFMDADYGEFAIRGYVACRTEGGGLFVRPPSRPECIASVLDAAARLKGPAFSDGAASVLNLYLADSKSY